jgi:hypothetical protein
MTTLCYRLGISALLLFSLLLFSCAKTVFIQPHIMYQATLSFIDDEAGVYISPVDLAKVYQKSTLWGGDIRIPIGSPLRDTAQQSFLPFFKRLHLVGSNSPEAAPYVVEIGLSEFEVTFGLDTRINITCSVSKGGESIFTGSFEGRGSGIQAAGLLGESSGQEEIRKSAEKAFQDAFQKAQVAFDESLKI